MNLQLPSQPDPERTAWRRLAALDRRTVFSIVTAFSGLVIGGLAWLAGAETVSDIAWAVTGVVAAIPLLVGIVASIRRREWGLDIIALLAVGGAIVLEEYLAAAIVGVMLATGEGLEAYAASRAAYELTSLLERAPRHAHRLVGDEVVTVGVSEVVAGDRLVVRPGEVVPADGVVIDGQAVLDQSSLTGESVPVLHGENDHVASGSVNAGGAFRLLASASADESTYAGIVRLVTEAQETKAPVSRLADRYAIGFVPVALGLAALAWAISGDPVRALAVLVVATPCPLILAVPIAVVSGISRAAKRGVVIKGGGVLEQLAGAEILIIDKTGTLTAGEAAVTDVTVFRPEVDGDEVLRLAASVDQISTHVLAAALVAAARERRLALSVPESVSETPGAGAVGIVEDRRVAVGSFDLVVGDGALTPEVQAYRQRAAREPSAAVWVGVDGELAGVIRLSDHIRADTARTLRMLRHRGVRRVVMATGDHPVVADAVGAALGVDRVLAECTPEEKVEAVLRNSALGSTVMVGDGINDAPALAAADVGVAMGARGATASSEAADVVLMVDRLDRLVDAIDIAQRSRRIATQSAALGMGLSGVGMVAALFGYLPPVAGALVQEGIDVIAILSALRALWSGMPWRATPTLPADLAARLKEEHLDLIPKLDEIANLADRLDSLPPRDAVAGLHHLDRFLHEELIPHEEADDREIYPILAGLLGGEDPMATMSMTHTEIFRLVGLFHRKVEALGPDLDGADVFDLRRVMYGLHAVLRLHFAQEEELYGSLDDHYHVRANAHNPS